jgi:hypothetical protein
VLGLQASERQHLSHMAHVGLVHIDGATQVPLVLGGFLGQDVSLERLAPLDGASWTDAKAFFRAAFRFHLGHLSALSSLTAAGDRNCPCACWPAAASS